MELNKLFKALRENKINISLHEENLKVGSDAPEVDPLLLEKIRENKIQIIDYLKTKASEKYEPIPLAPVFDGYPLSSAQMRLWVLSQFEGGNTAYIIPTTYSLEGMFNMECFKKSFVSIASRHEILRTVFREDQNQDIKQYILPLKSMNFEIDYRDLRGDASQENKVKKYIHEESVIPFDLYAGPLFRLGLFHLRDDYYVLSCVMHHIISDAWSIQVMIRELFLTYNALTKNEIIPLAPLKIQYKDYSVWQHSYRFSENMAASKAYWLSQFSGNLPVLDAFANNVRPKEKTYNGAVYHKTIDQKLTKGLKAIVRSTGGTLFMGLTGLLKVLLFRYTGQSDITLGTPIARRNHPDLEDQIGFYINTLALRTQFDGGDSFKALLNKVKAVTIASYEHQDYPFDELVEELNLVRDTSRNPLFDIMISLQNVDIGNHNVHAKGIDGLKVESYESARLGSMFDMTFNFVEQNGDISVSITYNTDLFHSQKIAQLGNHIETLLQSVIADPDMPIRNLSLLSEADRNELLETFNDTKVDYPQGESIISLFEKQAKATPDNIAVVFEESQLTYKELNEVSNKLSKYLLSNYALGKDILAGIKLERSQEMIVSILAILKTGSAYVPIDMDYPQERIDYIVKDSGSILVIDSTLYADFENNQDACDNSNLEIAISGNDLAYVIYTSGTTGHPKGVMVEHRNVNSLIHWGISEYESSGVETVLFVTSICFDISVFEIFYSLCSGKRLKVLSSGLSVGSGEYLGEKVLLNTVPSVVNSLQETGFNFKAIAVLNMAGEPIPSKILEGLDLQQLEVRNLYGPTEDTIYSTCYRFTEETPARKNIIGSPVSNSKAWILDQELQLVPIGVTGELYLEGDGVSRGYLNRPELTKEKFIAHPFKTGERLYKTGDLARWLHDGNIEFIGRNDDQVKIRGYRIELGEIAQCLMQHELIKDCLVRGIDTNAQEKDLACYYISAEEIKANELIGHLRKELPIYMVPNYYIWMPSFPLTSSGKIDKNSLPLPSGLQLVSATEYVAARNETERLLVSIWSEVLSIPKEKIGINDDFFDLGGHSLKATAILAKTRTLFKVNLDIFELYELHTIEEISKEINRKQWLNGEVSNDEVTIEIEL